MNSVKNILLIFASVLILMPATISFSHIFLGHGHELCDRYSESHYHKKNLDCDLHKFNQHPVFYLTNTDFSIFEVAIEEPQIYNYYASLNDFQALPFGLRAPPVFASNT